MLRPPTLGPRHRHLFRAWRAGACVQQLEGVDGKPADEEIVLSGFSFNGPAQREAIVNFEMRAWLSRLDAKGVDTLVLWDACFGGGMRGVEPECGQIQVRAAHPPADAKLDGAFPSIAMTEAEARAEVNTMSHVTFLAGATDDSVVPEMPGVDPARPDVTRGALSYFFARAIEGQLKSGAVSRVELFKFLAQNVSEKTAERQIIEAEPQRRGDSSVSGRTVFVVAASGGDGAAPAPAHAGSGSRRCGSPSSTAPRTPSAASRRARRRWS